MVKLTRVWIDCKTKEQKEQFKKEMRETQSKGTTVPFDKVVFEMWKRKF
jgi:hypothetical protein